ncbi:MAG: SHOCT domain-containing protein [Pseudodesulfovibrio sp.]|nr:SHOCT domain-containing protein [Pseudodesulfovibrio sp.]
MNIHDLPNILSGFFDFMDSPQWRAWPFNAGYGEHILPSIARLVFVTLIMGAILLFLRILFGPNGYFRDEEMDREAKEQLEQERIELEEIYSRGEITEDDYMIRMKRLKD